MVKIMLQFAVKLLSDDFDTNYYVSWYGLVIFCRGGVEDTRLKAKAKDSLSDDRTSRGQGQECSRPRPRIKDTGASALQKKGVQKIFLGDLQFIGVPRIFD